MGSWEGKSDKRGKAEIPAKGVFVPPTKLVPKYHEYSALIKIRVLLITLECWFSADYVPGIARSTLAVLAPSVHPATLEGGYHVCF